MRREQLTEKILDIKRRQGWSWRHITDEIGGVSPILIVGALVGQMKLVKPLAKKAAQLFGLSEEEQRMLNEVPVRGAPMPPTDPLLYRFYELVMVNGPAWKALIEEEFGDGIMSAIDFDMEIERQQGRPGQDHHERQVPALQILLQRAGYSVPRRQGRLRSPRPEERRSRVSKDVAHASRRCFRLLSMRRKSHMNGAAFGCERCFLHRLVERRMRVADAREIFGRAAKLH